MPIPRPLIVYFTNSHGGAGASSVSVYFPNLPVGSWRIVQWGDGTTSKVYGGVGNRMVHDYGNPQHEARMVSIYGDIDVVNFYDASGDRPKARLSFWGDYQINVVIFPDLTSINHP